MIQNPNFNLFLVGYIIQKLWNNIINELIHNKSNIKENKPQTNFSMMGLFHLKQKTTLAAERN